MKNIGPSREKKCQIENKRSRGQHILSRQNGKQQMIYVMIVEHSKWRLASAFFCFVWYVFMLGVAYSGFVELLRKFKYPITVPPLGDRNKIIGNVKASDRNEEYEGVTIIRPVKGIDAEFASCLESSFLQDYPKDKLQILLCVDNPKDPSIPIMKELIAKYPEVDSQILISQGYDVHTKISKERYGPNPKVNNLAKGYQAAKYDILWLMDVNVWADSSILKKSVISLLDNYNNGSKLKGSRPVQLVHHVPIALSISSKNQTDSEFVLSPRSSPTTGVQPKRRLLKKLGARLDEMFLLSSHSKFYVALNNLAIAPCVNGKSNIYRRSDLDRAVKSISKKKFNFFKTPSVMEDAKYYSSLGPGHSIKFFSRYIGEDNMIAIALWDANHSRTAQTGDIVIQPLGGLDNSVNDYIERRTRWLRVRKYMVFAATLIEPTTESIFCGIYGTYGFSTLFLNKGFSMTFFVLHLLVWMITDYVQYHSILESINTYKAYPYWLRYSSLPPMKRPLTHWIGIWCMREILAFPIWILAMIGHEVDWRGRPFKIKKDLTAEEL